MNAQSHTFLPHDFWQTIEPSGTFDMAPASGFSSFYPVRLPGGGELMLPVRHLPDGKHALASLIINQASFAVVARLAADLADRLTSARADVVVGLPTLGLTLAAAVAEKLGHTRYVPLGTSRKFWYSEELSVPLSSVTSPGQEKRLFVDPRMLPLLEGRRVLLVDDVLSSGASILAGLGVLERAGVEPVAIGAAMLQTRRWETALNSHGKALAECVCGVFETPMLEKAGDGWHPVA
jgi:adenine/guanine phosphoribosyltransferase-like PRPP-binding protein